MELFSLLSYPNPTLVNLKKHIEDWTHENKVCCHTLFNTLFNDLFNVYYSYKETKDIWDYLILQYIVKDVVRQMFVIENYYYWEMIKYKDIKIQINEYHKLLKDIKAESITLPDKFVSKLMIERLL